MTGPEARCRFAGPDDLPAVEEMLRSFLLEQATAGSAVQVTRRTVDWHRDLARSYVRGSLFGVVVLAEVQVPGGPDSDQPCPWKVVGFVLAGEDLGQPRLDTSWGRQAVVWGAWVAPSHRKLGTALAMLSWGRPQLVEQGFATAVMSVREENAEGDALTRAFGARPVERVFRFALSEEPRHG